MWFPQPSFIGRGAPFRDLVLCDAGSSNHKAICIYQVCETWCHKKLMCMVFQETLYGVVRQGVYIVQVCVAKELFTACENNPVTSPGHLVRGLPQEYCRAWYQPRSYDLAQCSCGVCRADSTSFSACRAVHCSVLRSICLGKCAPCGRTSKSLVEVSVPWAVLLVSLEDMSTHLLEWACCWSPCNTSPGVPQSAPAWLSLIQSSVFL